MANFRRLYFRLRYDAFLAFLLGAIIVGMIQIFSGDLWRRYGVAGVLLALFMVFLAFLAYRLLLWLLRKLLPPERYPIGDSPTLRRGLIMVLGGGSKQTGPVALEHHRSRLEHVWFITTDFTESIAHEMKRAAYPTLTSLQNVFNQWELTESQNAVERALSHARVLGIEAEDLICDVTGGTTAMTVGAVKACLANHIAMQMVTARYDETLQAVVPTGVILLDLEGDHSAAADGAAPTPVAG